MPRQNGAKKNKKQQRGIVPGVRERDVKFAGASFECGAPLAGEIPQPPPGLLCERESGREQPVVPLGASGWNAPSSATPPPFTPLPPLSSQLPPNHHQPQSHHYPPLPPPPAAAAAAAPAAAPLSTFPVAASLLAPSTTSAPSSAPSSPTPPCRVQCTPINVHSSRLSSFSLSDRGRN
eukprot:CAMPEP_0170746590 /NCGR_PEP_ID=MMETSP0437-20130122/8886_1 /TAXON_ID=0 /ORGANISM="Sexangularia sp." /LENGTH=177 /DNA_ID=CAMNT_0011085343 /DNA_START=58 /DNA_END=591 /DNA_ORIENTATION=-